MSEIQQFDSVRKKHLMEIKNLHLAMQTVIESPMSWEDKFDWVFHADCSQRICSLFREAGFEFAWCDPDTSYQEDVEAFANALARRMNELAPVIGL